MRGLVLLLAGLAAQPAQAEGAERSEIAAQWFAHCATFTTTDGVAQTLASMACVHGAMDFCAPIEAMTKESGCYDRIEQAARTEAAALIPVLQAIKPDSGSDRRAIDAALAQLAAPPVARDCAPAIDPPGCPAFNALVDWADLRALILQRSPD